MQLTTTIGTMSRTDARLIVREPFLIWMASYVVIISGILRFVLPWLNDWLQANYDFPFVLADYYDMFVGYLVFFTGGMMGGIIIGFIMLGERDDNTLTALLVTPVPLVNFLIYRLLMAAAIALFIMLAQLWLFGVVTIPAWQAVTLAVFALPVAAMFCLFTVVFAANKVQGFAMLKIAGSVGLLLIAAWFMQPPFEYIIALFPPYGLVKAYWVASAGGTYWWAWMLGGSAYVVLICALLTRRFVRLAYRG